MRRTSEPFRTTARTVTIRGDSDPTGPRVPRHDVPAAPAPARREAGLHRLRRPAHPLLLAGVRPDQLLLLLRCRPTPGRGRLLAGKLAPRVDADGGHPDPADALGDRL